VRSEVRRSFASSAGAARSAAARAGAARDARIENTRELSVATGTLIHTPRLSARRTRRRDDDGDRNTDGGERRVTCTG